jgi:phosphatidylserine decarboxylase
LQKQSNSAQKIVPFIKKYGIDSSEFVENQFASFNDFFIRKLKPEARPIEAAPTVAVLPADGRYLVFDSIKSVDHFYVKGQKFDLVGFLQDPILVDRFYSGSMVIARLCPTDYHRFHFPCDGFVGPSRLIDGPLFSVNPLALRKRFSIFSENKRMITEMKTTLFGELLYVEIGATCVGTIHQTYLSNSLVSKGDEKGYFSFGGSCVVLLFERGKIVFDQDLLKHSSQGIETKALFGQSLGKQM